MKKPVVYITILFILAFGAGAVLGQSEEAKRHFDYGIAAMKTAGYEAAVKEFEQAARLAPAWPEAFYNLGLAQEAAKKYADAAKNYREYLRLAPNAKDAAEIKSLINKMEYMAIPVPEIAKGVMGIPWEAGPDEIIDAMAGQGYQLKSRADSLLTFYMNNSNPLRQHFFMKSNVLYKVETMALVRSGNPQTAKAVFRQKFDELSGEYGQPESHYSRIDKAPMDGHDIPREAAGWKIVDTRTSITYYISLEYTVTWWTDTGSEDQYTVNVYYNKEDKQPLKTPPPKNPEDLTRRPRNPPPLSQIEAEAERLIADAGGINAANWLSRTPLHRAAEAGEKEVAGLLIAKGADVNAKDKDGRTPLFMAAGASSGGKETVELLIAKGADANAKDKNDCTPLFEAAGVSTGEKETAELLMAKGADVNAKSNGGETPLHRAVGKRNAKVAKLLIDKGADINARNSLGETPLFEADYILEDNPDMVELLIAEGADINAKNAVGLAPLHQVIISHHIRTAEMMIAKGADIEVKDDYGGSPLRWAATGGDLEMASLLIAKGADVNAKDNGGNTILYRVRKPFMSMKKEVQNEMIDLLKKHGAR